MELIVDTITKTVMIREQKIVNLDMIELGNILIEVGEKLVSPAQISFEGPISMKLEKQDE